jgi:hypothetical protein
MVLEMLAWIKTISVNWYVESHGEPARPAQFWEENRILESAATLIQGGVTERRTLIHAIENRLAPHLPDDTHEVIELFLTSI